MQAKYTPGPWTRYGTKVAAKCGPVGKIVGDTVIADCYGHRGLSDTERKANANLISAAPDMAEALLEAVHECGCSLRERESGHLIGCYAPKAIEALTKAGLL